MRQVALIALWLLLLLALAFGHALATAAQSRGRGLNTREFDTPAPPAAQTGKRAGKDVPCGGTGTGTGATIMADPVLMRDDPYDPSPARVGPPPCEPEQSPSWYMELMMFDHLIVSDSHGNTDRLYEEEEMAFQTVRGVGYTSLCADVNCVMVTMPVGETYTFKFKSSHSMRIDLVRGVGNTHPDVAVRYLDLHLPQGAWALLTITPLGPQDVRVDKDGDGRFETTIRPTASLTGAAALDTDGPSIEFSAAPLDANNVLVTINATDPSGVRSVLYSLGGPRFQYYTGPFKVEASRVSEVQAFADDKAGNRSGLYYYKSRREPPRRAP